MKVIDVPNLFESYDLLFENKLEYILNNQKKAIAQAIVKDSTAKQLIHHQNIEYIKQIASDEAPLPIDSNSIFTQKIDDIFKNILNTLAEFDPTPNQNYFQWLFNQWKKGEFRLLEDSEKINELLGFFDEHKNDLNKKDINQYTVKELHETVKQYMASGGNEKIERQLIARNEAEIVFEEGEIRIIVPKTVKASKYFAQDANWCTKYPKNFKNYSSEGPLYIIEVSDRPIFQLHFESGEFMDANDEEHSLIDIFFHTVFGKDIFRFFEEQGYFTEFDVIKEGNQYYYIIVDIPELAKLIPIGRQNLSPDYVELVLTGDDDELFELNETIPPSIITIKGSEEKSVEVINNKLKEILNDDQYNFIIGGDVEDLYDAIDEIIDDYNFINTDESNDVEFSEDTISKLSEVKSEIKRAVTQSVEVAQRDKAVKEVVDYVEQEIGLDVSSMEETAKLKSSPTALKVPIINEMLLVALTSTSSDQDLLDIIETEVVDYPFKPEVDYALSEVNDDILAEHLDLYLF